MVNGHAPHRPVVVAAIAASLLMLVFNALYRAVAAGVSGPVNRSPLDPRTLERFPRQIGDWMGQDIPLDEAIRERTGADAIINRRYSRQNGGESLGLYVASGVTARALVGHRPEVCFISSGWTLMDHRSVMLSLPEGGQLPCTIFQFSRGMLDTARMTVLHYYIVEGQYCGDVSLLRRRVWRGSSWVDYAAQVQIVASGENLTPEATTKLLCVFAVDSAPALIRLFQEQEEDRDAGEARSVLTEK